MKTGVRSLGWQFLGCRLQPMHKLALMTGSCFYDNNHPFCILSEHCVASLIMWPESLCSVIEADGEGWWSVNCVCTQEAAWSFWSLDSGWLAGSSWLDRGPVTVDGWGRLKGLWRGPDGWRARGHVRGWNLCWISWQATVCRCPPHSSTAPEEEGPTSRVGFVIIEKTKRKRERERGKACVFPRHASSCETMIYAFLRTLGSQNVTFNQAHWEESKC